MKNETEITAGKLSLLADQSKATLEIKMHTRYKEATLTLLTTLADNFTSHIKSCILSINVRHDEQVSIVLQ